MSILLRLHLEEMKNQMRNLSIEQEIGSLLLCNANRDVVGGTQ